MSGPLGERIEDSTLGAWRAGQALAAAVGAVPAEPERFEPTLACIRAAYGELPGLSLTMAQARRLWGLDEHIGRRLLTALVSGGFLTEMPNGTFVRRDRFYR